VPSEVDHKTAPVLAATPRALALSAPAIALMMTSPSDVSAGTVIRPAPAGKSSVHTSAPSGVSL
jgi:hypothetical protein